jgi:predicted pyridoxine 5'-phosphate oxidase superfamily flavin-nucleotide-binding protein
MENPEVGLVFMVPGMLEVLRINGRARLTTDPELLATLEAKGKLPRAALVVDIRDVYIHCGKAIIRADLWNPEVQIDRKDFPSMGQINQDWYGVDGKMVDEKLAKDYVNTLY